MPNYWTLIGIMNDDLPEVPSPPAPEPGHRLMPGQFWFQEGSPKAPWSLRAGGTSLKQGMDFLNFYLMRTSRVSDPGQATIKITFQKVDESTGEISPGSPLDATLTKWMAEGFIVHHVRGDLADGWYEEVDYYVIPYRSPHGPPPYHPTNAGLYTIAIDLDFRDGAGTYYLDPLLRIDPETR